jgi:glycolate oxidase iron-sulfur subunit
VLGLDDDELASCVQCGLCLPHCPTFRTTGLEAYSPRGRIALMRRIEAGEGEADEEFAEAMGTCVQCRGCEPVCPSGVPFGHLMDGTRAALAAAGAPGAPPRLLRVAYAALGHHRLVLAGSTVAAAAQRVGLLPRALSARLGLPARLALRRPTLAPAAAERGQPTVWLHTGCVMDAWQRPVHAAAARVITATGAGIRLPGSGAGCCGALHVHAGLADGARALARRTMAAMPGGVDQPIVVDSAGCGAALVDYERLVGTPEAGAFSARVVDVHTWLAERLDRLPAPRRRVGGTVAVQDPCHLRHVLRTHEAVRTVLTPHVERLVELDDDGLCCGAGGAYALQQPRLAGAIRVRKLEAVAHSGATLVASANPGCALHLAAAGLRVRHPVELIDEALFMTERSEGMSGVRAPASRTAMGPGGAAPEKS